MSCRSVTGDGPPGRWSGRRSATRQATTRTSAARTAASKAPMPVKLIPDPFESADDPHSALAVVGNYGDTRRLAALLDRDRGHPERCGDLPVKPPASLVHGDVPVHVQ